MLADRWFPFFDVAKTLEEMDRAFDTIGRPLGLRSVPRGTFPAINLHEQGDSVVLTADAVVLKLDMPGVAKDNVDITVDKDLLTIVGTAQPEELGEPVYRETCVGDCRRQSALTGDVDRNDISASMNDGVLTVKIGKTEQVKPKKIKIAAAR